MPQYQVKAGDTLSQIAAAHQVSVSELQAENTFITDPDHIEAGWRLSIPAGRPESGPALPPAQSANDSSTDDVECSACQLEYVAFLHVTEDTETVYALTQAQLDEVDAEVSTLHAPLKELKQAEAGSVDDIPAAREAAWNQLKELGALPRPKESTTAEDLLTEYEARWTQENQELERQERRLHRIKWEIGQIRSQILLPAQQRPLDSPRDQLSLKVFTTLCVELEGQQPTVEAIVEAQKLARQRARTNRDNLEKRLKMLRAALEAEIRYRVATSSSDVSQTQKAQLQTESEELKQATAWPNFISESDMNELVQRQQRLNELEEETTPVMDQVRHYMGQATVAVFLWNLIDREEFEASRKKNEELKRLIEEQEAMLQRLVETSPPHTVDVVAKPQMDTMPSRPIVEVKHTAAGGYRYMRRQVLAQIRQNWRPLKMADVRAAMTSGDFKRALGEAGDSLKTEQSLKLKLAEWKSSDNNFFNQLEVELFKEHTESEDGRFSADAEAQMFRFASQAGLEAVYNPSKGEAYIGGKLEGSYSLLQGQASLGAQLPGPDGFKLELDYIDGQGAQKTLECGYIRADAEYKIQGFAGACASLSAQARVSSDTGQVGLSGETHGEAFAGASLSNEASFGVKWKAAYAEVLADQNAGTTANEDQQAVDDAFKSLLDVKPEFAVSAGIGAAFDFSVGMVESKVVLYLKGHLVLGAGGGGGVGAELNVQQLWELVKFIRWSLERSDFRFLEWIEETAFEHITFLLKVFAVSSEDFEAVMEQGAEQMDILWERLTTADTKVRDTAQKVLQHNQLSQLTPPAKAALLTILVEDSSALLGFEDPYRAIGAEAAIKILETVRSHRELVEILRRMGNEEGKGSFVDFKRNFSKLIRQRLFNSAQADRTFRWLEGLYS
ncbi:LysM peptidoglycan-binding domain-containing protein [Marinobacter mangrovi]|uniref:LysM peptidoglycan-binding domain-containing protein n=1 Tax=Marinobacter mangrovi TaxID=2803918 RepID=UPI0019314ECD|nr:LysM peptidoglycan-binding domain-containing protein [Marinobacter mangrovi]